MGLESSTRRHNRRTGQRRKEGDQKPRQSRVKDDKKVEEECAEQIEASGFDEHEGASILRQDTSVSKCGSENS